jgi:hypothetical protein
MLEWRIAKGGAIHYNGDLIYPPDKTKMQKPSGKIKTIRGKANDDSDSD